MMNNYFSLQKVVLKMLFMAALFLGSTFLGANLYAQCDADAGSLTADVTPVQLSGADVDISASVDTSPNVPAGFNVLYILTSGTNLLVEDIDTTPEFTVDTPGSYTIHTIVGVLFDTADPDYLPLLTDIFPGVSTGADILDLIANEGVCADLLVDGAQINVEACSADAGTLTADVNPVQLANGSTTISASVDTAPTVPTNYEVLYVLTSGASLVIEQTGTSLSFNVSASGNYTIHTLVAETNDPNDPNFLDLNIIEPGVTTGGQVATLIGASGICASLDVNGAPVSVQDCNASAGTLAADVSPVAIAGATLTISATEVDPPVVPSGYEQLYVLTSGPQLLIEDFATTPSFEVDAPGLYTIHTFVAELDDPNDPNFIDPNAFVPGITTGGDVITVIAALGACADLDATGAQVIVEDCTADAGSLAADATPVQLAGGSVTISATEGTAPTVPASHEVLYVLTSGAGLIIEDAGASPSFEVTSSGLYTIHTLVAEITDTGDPNYLDLNLIDFGTTPASDVIDIVTNNELCAALDVTGAEVNVEDCTADAGTLTADVNPVQLAGGSATISATEDTAPTVPADYEVVYVLTSGTGLVIEDIGASPSFEVTSSGLYTIHTLVAELDNPNDPNYLDAANIVVPGVTTGFDVLALVASEGLCASLDATGASVTVEDCGADAGSLTADVNPVQLAGANVSISATENIAPTVPANYEVLYVLTSGAGLIIEDAGTSPSFEVTAAGLYTIHTLVAETTDTTDPNYLDLNVIEFGTTPASAVIDIVTNNGLCAALDVAGAPINVEDCTADAGTLSADASPVQLAGASVTISATQNAAPTVPANYEVLYVLTSGAGLIIEDAGTSPGFEVTAAGLYTIHTLVAETTDTTDPNYLDLNVIDFGTTPASAVLDIVTNNGLCAALDVTGAEVNVEDCTADAGSLTADATPVELESGSATISATQATAPTVPANYEVVYVLTSGTGLVIEQTGAAPSFVVTAAGDYTIHTLVAELTDPNDPNFLDTNIINPGVTTGVDVLNFITDNGLCAALDVPGAPIEVTDSGLSIDDNELSGSIRLVKNPVQDQLQLSNSNNTQINSMVIYDISGRLIQTIPVNSAQSEISADVSALSNGTYFLVLNSDRGQLSLRWIKNR